MSLRNRLKNAARALCGKPAESLSLGVDVKRCDQCDRGYCAQCCYKDAFKELTEENSKLKAEYEKLLKASEDEVARVRKYYEDLYRPTEEAKR
jgi:hypothetical protein